MHSTTMNRRLLAAIAAVAGLVHLLVPGVLLASARQAYGRILDVEFRPRNGAKRRVRLIGAMLFGVAAVLWPGQQSA